MEQIWLCLFAMLAGLIDSVAGGGGLIQLPALLLYLPQAEAATVATVFGTNKFASLCGTSVAVYQYGRRCPIPWRAIGPGAATALVFSFWGAHTVAAMDASFLRPAVLCLLIAVTAYTWLRKDFGDEHRPTLEAHKQVWAALATGAGIGFYDGFFGPGTGSFLIFIFIGWFGFDFLTASASAKVINLATNLAAVSFFAATGHVAWRYAVPMALCNIIGNAVGSHLALLKGNRFVRRFFLLVAVAMIGRFGWQVFNR